MTLGLSKKDWAIVTVCMIAVAICMYFLLQPEDISRSGNRQVFGDLESSIRDVKQRGQYSFLWRPA